MGVTNSQTLKTQTSDPGNSDPDNADPSKLDKKRSAHTRGLVFFWFIAVESIKQRRTKDPKKSIPKTQTQKINISLLSGCYLMNIDCIHDFHNGGSLGRNCNYHHQSEARKAFAQPHMAFDS